MEHSQSVSSCIYHFTALFFQFSGLVWKYIVKQKIEKSFLARQMFTVSQTLLLLALKEDFPEKKITTQDQVMEDNQRRNEEKKGTL